MLLSRRTGDQEVIYVWIAEGQAVQHLVDEPLECLCRVLQPKGHV